LLTEGLRAPPERLVLIFEAPADERDTGRIEKKLGAPGFVRGFSSAGSPQCCRPLARELKLTSETNMATNSQPPKASPEAVGANYGGKWIAWSDDAVKIVASGDTLEAVRQQALDAGVKLPGLEFVPPSDRAFVGGV
jgi:hypothetical protein